MLRQILPGRDCANHKLLGRCQAEQSGKLPDLRWVRPTLHVERNTQDSQHRTATTYSSGNGQEADADLMIRCIGERNGLA